jgi:hypothetical protein
MFRALRHTARLLVLGSDACMSIEETAIPPDP